MSETKTTVAEALLIIRASVPADTVLVLCGDGMQVTSHQTFPTGTHQITCKPRQQDGAPT
ncbi:MAG TPA: hypothetical protein VIP28_15415 [Nocardioides sp.]